MNYEDLWYYCLRRTVSPADAEDVLADVFATAWRKFDQLPSGRDVRPWLFTIAANLVRNHNRKHTRRQGVHVRLIHEAERRPSVELCPPESLALNDGSDIVAAFRSLRPADQEILALSAWDELSNREISIVVGCSELAVRSRLHRARKKFERSLQKLQRSSPRQHVEIEEVARQARSLNQ